MSHSDPRQRDASRVRIPLITPPTARRGPPGVPIRAHVAAHDLYEAANLLEERMQRRLELLDHDFYLFTDLGTGADAVIYRRPDGRYGFRGELGKHEREQTIAPLVVEPPPPTLTEARARERLDVGGEPFVFYLDPGDDLGRVLYRRYDGQYGLIAAA